MKIYLSDHEPDNAIPGNVMNCGNCHYWHPVFGMETAPTGDCKLPEDENGPVTLAIYGDDRAEVITRREHGCTAWILK